MTEKTIEDIDVIAIIVQFKDGCAHQVLATKSNKRLIIDMLDRLEGNLRVSDEIMPVEFISKK